MSTSIPPLSEDLTPAPLGPPGSRPTWRGLLGILREALAGSSRDFTSGSLNSAIALLAIPMVLEMAMESVFALVDAFFVSRLGADALATVGLAESMLTMVYALAMGLSMGTTAMVARRIGEKRPEAAAQVAVHALGLGVALALVLGLPAAIGAPTLLRLMGASDAVVATGSGYTRILLGSNLVIMMLFVHNAIFRGAGDAGFAMRALGLANGLNLVLDPCLIFGLGPFPELGLTGAAVATTLGRGGGVLLQIWLLRRGRGRLAVRAADWRLQPAVLWRLIRLGASGAGQWLVATASWVVLVRIVASFGSTAVAAYTLAVRIIIFALLPAFGISNAAATLVGQNLGACRPERAARSVWLTGLYACFFLLGVMAAFMLGGEALVGLFTDDPALAARAAACLRIMSYGYAFYGWGMVMTQAFNGAGDTTTPLLINLVFFWLGQIPLAWFLSRQPWLAVDGVFWAVALSESALALAAMAMFSRGRWKTRMV